MNNDAVNNGDAVNNAQESNDAESYNPESNEAAAIIAALSPRAAKLLATEILLANPESLGDDVLESCLYILRERLQEA